MEKALLWDRLRNGSVKCLLCPHRCSIPIGQVGICGVRKNVDGVLMSMNDSLTIAQAIDPIEKKPLAEFLPGTRTYSFAAVGCNLHCPWCQNHDISQAKERTHFGRKILPLEHVQEAIQQHTPSISYTYSEPTVYFEYAIATMRLAKQKGLKNIWVTNGFMSQEALRLILPYLDAANVDVKGGKKTYDAIGGNLQIVLENIKAMKDFGVHVEVTTLLVTGVNDTPEEMEEVVDALVEKIGLDFVWHVSRFFPRYHMTDMEPTAMSSMQYAKQYAISKGIRKVLLGNVF